MVLRLRCDLRICLTQDVAEQPGGGSDCPIIHRIKLLNRNQMQLPELRQLKRLLRRENVP